MKEGTQMANKHMKICVTSYLTLMAQVLVVPCGNQMHVRIFESLQLEGSYVGDLLYLLVVGRTVEAVSR